MIINKKITILISYKLQSENIWYQINIKPQDYYDNNYCDEKEEIDIDSIALYDHAIDYISLENKNMIQNTKLCIQNEETKEKIIIQESYWNSQRNLLIERTDFDLEGNISYHEIIIQTLIQENKKKQVWETIRFLKKEQIFNPYFHSFIMENEEKFISEEFVTIN